MRPYARGMFGIVLLTAILWFSSQGLAREPSQKEQAIKAVPESHPEGPDLSDIVPQAVKLDGRLGDLENDLKASLDASSVESRSAEIGANLEDLDAQIKQLAESKDYRFSKLLDLKQIIVQKDKSLREINNSLGGAIQKLAAWRKEWLSEKRRWDEWRSFMAKEGMFDQVKSVFEKADDRIDTALNLLSPRLSAILKVQEKAGYIQARTNGLAANLDKLIEIQRHGALLNASPPMFSRQYLSQFGSELWYAVQEGLWEISWPSGEFFILKGWIILLHALLSLVVMIVVYRKREVLKESKHWRFLALRPISAGFFLGTITTLLLYDFWGMPYIWGLLCLLVGGTAFARLAGVLTESRWKTHLVYGLLITFIVARLFYVVNLPLPLIRLYTFLVALVGFFFFSWWARESRRRNESRFYTWALWFGSILFVVLIGSEFLGRAGLAEYLFATSIRSIAVMFPFILFAHVIHGGLEWLFRTSPLRRTAIISKDTDVFVRRLRLLIDVAIGVVVLCLLLVIWGGFDTVQGALKGLLALGFNLGSQRISVGLIIASACIFYGSFLASWILQKLLMDEVLARRRVQWGVRVSITRLVHYIIISAGFLVALSTLGIEVTKLTIILGALGVGIGFGLQGIVNNFVSGLILLFERPVRVGDWVEIDGNWSEIKRIGLRATTVQTFDQADVIVPNADLVNNAVTNWTLSNRQVRLIIPVGVAYGSDVPLVVEALMACAHENPKVASVPEPQVLFLSFGESSLDFELRVWLFDIGERLNVRSELHQEIDRRFREAKIEIAFPQRDLHLRSVDESVIASVKENP
jgi:potassium efflux system protein